MSHDSLSSIPRDGSPQLKGKRPDLIELIAATLHSVKAYDLPTECKSFDGFIPALKTGKIDAALSGMNATEERRK